MSSKEPPALKQKRVLSVPMNESKGNVETEGNSSDIYREAKSHNARDSSHKSLHLRRWEIVFYFVELSHTIITGIFNLCS